MRRWLNLLFLIALPALPCHATFAVVAHTGAAGTGSTATTAAINTTGADGIYVGVVAFGTTACASLPTSSPSAGTFTALTNQGTGGQPNTCLFYLKSPTTNASQTFSVTVGSGFPSLDVMAVSGSLTTGGADQTNGAVSSVGATSLQPGSVTPGVNNSILVTILGVAVNLTPTINLSYTITDNIPFGSGTNIGICMAYLIQTTAAASNPTWTATGNTGFDLTANIATFQPAATTTAPTQAGGFLVGP